MSLLVGGQVGMKFKDVENKSGQTSCHICRGVMQDDDRVHQLFCQHIHHGRCQDTNIREGNLRCSSCGTAIVFDPITKEVAEREMQRRSQSSGHLVEVTYQQEFTGQKEFTDAYEKELGQDVVKQLADDLDRMYGDARTRAAYEKKDKCERRCRQVGSAVKGVLVAAACFAITAVTIYASKG